MQHPYERELEVGIEEVEQQFISITEIAWAEYILNPRQLRGSDFLMRWSQGVWSEKRMTQAVNRQGEFYCIAYGPSGVAPDDDPREHELYFERLEAAGLGSIKRPDLLIYRADDRTNVDALVMKLGGSEELPFIAEDEPDLAALLDLAVVAVECENSLWKATMMPEYGNDLRPQKRLEGKPGMPKNAVLPTIIIKEEDRGPLAAWQDAAGVPIHVWHGFYDMAFGMALDTLDELLDGGLIQPTNQIYQAPGGATTSKTIYKIYYHYAYELGEVSEEPTLESAFITDRNGHILPYVRFEGGSLDLAGAALEVLRGLA